MTKLQSRTMPTFLKPTALAVVAVSIGHGAIAGNLLAAPGSPPTVFSIVSSTNNMVQVFNSRSMRPDGTTPSECPGDADANKLLNGADVTSVLGA